MTDRHLLVQDNIKGSFAIAIARYYFHPDVEVRGDKSGETGELQLPEGEKIAWRVDGGRQNVIMSTYHPEFGLSIPNRCLEIIFEGNSCDVTFTWK